MSVAIEAVREATTAYSDLVQAMEDWFHAQPPKAGTVPPCAIPGGAAAVRGDVSVLVRGDCLLPPTTRHLASLAAWAEMPNPGREEDAVGLRAWLAPFGDRTVRIYGETFNAGLVTAALAILPCPPKLRLCVAPLPRVKTPGDPVPALLIDAPHWRVIVAPVGFPAGMPLSFPSWPVVRWGDVGNREVERG